MGGGAKSSSTSASGSAQKWAQPFAKQGAQDVTGVFNANQAGLNNLTKLTQNELVPGLYDKFKAGLPGAGMARQFSEDVLSGKYMTGNPALQGMLDMTNRDVMAGVNSRLATAGRYGSGVHDDVAARALADNETKLRYQNYADEMNRMGQAAQFSQQISNADAAQTLQGIGLGAEIPYTGANNLASSLGALFNGGTQTSKEKGASPLWGVIGSGLGAAGAAFCDVAMKENIVLHHVDPDGLAFYAFNYKPEYVERYNLPTDTQVNPMAQDVAIYRPWALGPEADGFMTIYPAKL